MTKRIITTVVAALAIGALCLTVAASTKKQVAKDFVIRGTAYCEITGMWRPADRAETLPPVISFNIIGADGVATHTGRYGLVGHGDSDLYTGQGWDTGVFIAANGDKINWDGVIYPDPTPKLKVTLKEVNPGTGRFANAKGGFIADIFDLNIDWAVMTMSFSFTGSGELAY